MADLHVRRYEPADADAVWDLHERALRDIGMYDEEFAHLDADLRAVESEYLESGGEFLIGEREGGDSARADTELVAMGAVQPATAVDHHEGGDRTGVVRRMRVAPVHQGQGYGARILTELERRAAKLGFERLVLDTRPGQAAARGLYESFGYVESHRESTPAGEMIYCEKELE